MKNQENTDEREETRQRLHVFSAGLSLICPGLGQLIQGRPGRFLWHVAMLVVACIGGYPLLSLMLESNVEQFPKIFPLLFTPLGWPLLFIIPLVLLSVLDAATWAPGKPPLLEKQLIRLTVWFVSLNILLWLATSQIDAARGAAHRMQCSKNLHQIVLAFHNYHEVYNSLPPAYTVDENNKPLHSWRVLLLPFIGEQLLYEQIQLDEPWNSEHNRQFHGLKLSHYKCPASSGIVSISMKDRSIHHAGNCNYFVVIGNETFFPGPKSVSLNEIAENSKQTILVVERMLPVCWMDPNNEIQFDTACEGINQHFLGIGSGHPGGANVCLADASVRFYSEIVEKIKHLKRHLVISERDPTERPTEMD